MGHPRWTAERVSRRVGCRNGQARRKGAARGKGVQGQILGCRILRRPLAGADIAEIWDYVAADSSGSGRMGGSPGRQATPTIDAAHDGTGPGLIGLMTPRSVVIL